MASAADSTLAYPVAKAGDTVDTLHGVDIPDPFRGLEEDTPETKEWVASQVRWRWRGGAELLTGPYRGRCNPTSCR